MKRKLQRAYDTMAMPDDCARRIEQHLLIRQQQQKTGWYTQVVMPATRPKHSWVTAVSAVSAVCMMLVLFAGGTIFCLRTMNMEVKQPVQVPSTASQTASGDYSLVTDIPAEEVEAFAQEIRKNIWEDNWELFASQVHYPIEIQDKTIENEGGLTGLLLRNTVSSDFLEEVRKESCNQMFCNWQGICMGNGRIWINEVDGVLKITAINGMFTDLVDPMDMEYSELPDGNYAVTSFSGRVEGITFPTGYNRHIVTQIGTGQPVLESGDAIKSVTIPESVTVIGDYAFADCEALESVHFRGDAPAEAEGVFEGSGNVTVYYPEGTSGWGDTWCGRKTAVYTHLSLGKVQIKEIPAFLRILNDTEKFYSYDLDREFFISEYCESQSAERGKTVTIPKFTLADLGGADALELILWVQAGEKEPDHFLILRLEDGEINSYTIPYLGTMGFKKDGAVYSAIQGTQAGAMRLEFLKELGTDRYFVSEDFHSKPPVRWHAWPCVQTGVVLESYEAVSTEEWGSPMGAQFRLFEQLAEGTMENDLETIRLYILSNGLRCGEEEGGLTIFDPATPGTLMYGSVENDQLASIGYYISCEYGELQAEIRRLNTDAPVYKVGSHLELLDSHGTTVSSVRELLDYLRAERLQEDRSRDVPRIMALSEEYARCYLAGDTDGMAALTSPTSSQKPSGYPGDGQNGKILNISLTGTMVLEDTASVSVCIQEPDQTDSWSFLMLILVREGEDWKVQSCALEK